MHQRVDKDNDYWKFLRMAFHNEKIHISAERTCIDRLILSSWQSHVDSSMMLHLGFL